jgi:hypothetical protein
MSFVWSAAGQSSTASTHNLRRRASARRNPSFHRLLRYLSAKTPTWSPSRRRGARSAGRRSPWRGVVLVSYILSIVSSSRRFVLRWSSGSGVARMVPSPFWRIFRGVSHFSVFEKVQRRKSSLVFCFGNDCDLVPILGRGSEDRELCDADDAVVEEREREYWSRRTSSRDMELAFWRIRSSSSRCSWNLDCMVAEGGS